VHCSKRKRRRGQEDGNGTHTAHLDSEGPQREDVGRVDAVEVGLDLRDSRPAGRRRQERRDGRRQQQERQVAAGEHPERRPVAGGVHEGGNGLVLEARDVLDGEVDEEADDPGEDADGEAEGPLEHHVPHLVRLAPRPPVLVEQLVLYHLVVEALDRAGIGADHGHLGGVGGGAPVEQGPVQGPLILLLHAHADILQRRRHGRDSGPGGGTAEARGAGGGGPTVGR